MSLRALAVLTPLAPRLARVAGCGQPLRAKSAMPNDGHDTSHLAKCSVAASREQPLVTEWPAPYKARLEALLQAGAVAVEYSGCELQDRQSLPPLRLLRVEEDDALHRHHRHRRTRTISTPSCRSARPRSPVQLKTSGSLHVQTTVSGSAPARRQGRGGRDERRRVLARDAPRDRAQHRSLQARRRRRGEGERGRVRRQRRRRRVERADALGPSRRRGRRELRARHEGRAERRVPLADPDLPHAHPPLGAAEHPVAAARREGMKTLVLRLCPARSSCSSGAGAARATRRRSRPSRWRRRSSGDALVHYLAQSGRDRHRVRPQEPGTALRSLARRRTSRR